MLLWAGLALIVLGVLCFAIDRRAALFFYMQINRLFRLFIIQTTDLAKGAHWLAVSGAAFLIAQIALALEFDSPFFYALSEYALAFLISLAAGSALLHGMKLALCRRRPRDDFEFGLYGFRPFAFERQYNSFPSGHALTIVCVAAVASAAWPQLAPVWFAISLWLGLTRALLTSHFLSDVFIGAGIGLIAARETIVVLFPALVRPWF